MNSSSFELSSFKLSLSSNSNKFGLSSKSSSAKSNPNPKYKELSHLENFFSPYCSIIGPLPEEPSKLKSLSKLDLTYNPLKYQIPIPNSVGKLQNLSILNLVYTELNGSIPAEIGKCRNLKTLMLSFNSLTGTLPLELSELPIWIFSFCWRKWAFWDIATLAWEVERNGFSFTF